MAVPIGQKLREARLARGLSLEDVQHHTRISRTLLAAMENDDLGAFPNQTYARTFFAAYARHLGVEVSGFLRLFQPHGLGGVIQYHPYLQAPIEHTGPERRRPPSRSPTTPSSTLLVGLAALALAAGVAIWTGLQDGQDHRPAGARTVEAGPATTATSTSRESSPPAATAAPSPSPRITPPDLPVLRALPVEANEPAPPTSVEPKAAEAEASPLPLVEF
jgi:cytoskeletal protein RodZ